MRAEYTRRPGTAVQLPRIQMQQFERHETVEISVLLGKYELGTPAQSHRLTASDWHAAPAPLAQGSPHLLSPLFNAAHRLMAHVCCRLHI